MNARFCVFRGLPSARLVVAAFDEDSARRDHADDGDGQGDDGESSAAAGGASGAVILFL